MVVVVVLDVDPQLGSMDFGHWSAGCWKVWGVYRRCWWRTRGHEVCTLGASSLLEPELDASSRMDGRARGCENND